MIIMLMWEPQQSLQVQVKRGWEEVGCVVEEIHEGSKEGKASIS